MTRGERNIRWIERHCIVPEGLDVGKPVKLRPWQCKLIRGIYDGDTRRAIISFGRKNGKTSLSAFLLLLHLCGPEARPNSQLYSAAQSREQAGIVFSLAAKMVRMSPELNQVVTVRDTAKQLFCRELGTLYRALSAEASTAYGLSPVFVVHDELGQVRGPRSEIYEALETAAGAQAEPLSIIISTQAPTEADLLSVLIDDATRSGDPRTKLFLWTAGEDLDPFSEEAFKAANPAYGDFLNPVEVRDMAESAKRMPAREGAFRNLVLNQRVEVFNPFVSLEVWNECAGKVAEDWDDIPVYGGLDLAECNDLTALVLIAAFEGRWHVRPTFWLPEEGLRERARQDRVPYDAWHRQGLLATTPGRSVEYEFVAHHIRGLFEAGLNVRTIAFDRWNFRHLRPWLIRAGFSESEVTEHFTDFGQGYRSMSPALRDLESDLLNGKVVHGRHPILDMCAANAVVQRDPAGNRKLDKARSRGRIDGMVALAMAKGVAGSAEMPAPRPSYQMLFLQGGPHA